MLEKPLSYTVLSVLIVNLLAMTGDVTLSWTSPIYPKLYSNDSTENPLGRPITESEDSWLGSLVTIGAMVGPFPFSFIGEKFGRKIGLLCIAVPHIISFFTFAFAKSIYLFYFGRVLGGLAMGGGYTLLPMYIAEIAQDSNRGTLSLSMNVFWAIGNFLPYAIGPFMSIMWFNIILACVPTAFFVIFLIICAETPYYLVAKGKHDKAEKSLMKLRSFGSDVVEKELAGIKMHLKTDEDGHFSDILKKRELRNALMICIVLIMAQEMTGFCAITFYLQPIFESVGSSLPSEFSALIVGSAILLSSFFAPFLVDRLGRRVLIISSCFGMFLALSLLGAFFFIQDSTDLSTDTILWVPIFSLIFYIVFFNIGMGCIPWTLAAELFPNNVKQIAASTVSSSCWITTFVITRFFNDMNNSMGKAGTFWFFAASSLASAAFCIAVVPETKGKSFSEIQDMLKFGHKHQPRTEPEQPVTVNSAEKGTIKGGANGFI